MGYFHRKQSADREAGSSETEADSYGIDAERMTAEGLRGLRAEWQAAPPMPTDVRAHWWLTTRIRWSLHTTVIEGYKVDYPSASALLVQGRVDKDARIEDVEAVRGHDAALRMLREWVNQAASLSEDGLRAMHAQLLVNPYPARSVDGAVLNYLVMPGIYKRQPNFIRTRGGLVEFPPPEDVPRLMREFVERWNLRLDVALQDPCHYDPAYLWADCHNEFINIHPYDDGNGRMARLVVNCLAMRMGYPPMVILADHRADYFEALDRARPQLGTSTLQPLRDFLAAAMAPALDFAIAVARGACDPTFANEHGDPRKAYRKDYPYAYPLDLSAPKLRAQDEAQRA